MGRFTPDSLSEWEKGYIVGFFAGDGCFNVRLQYYSYCVKFVVNAKTEMSIADFLMTLLKKSHTTPFSNIRENRVNIRVVSKGLLNFIRMYVGYPGDRDGPHKIFLQPWGWTKNFALGVIAGLIDSDGCVTYDKGKYIRALISTKSKAFALQIKETIERTGIKATCHRSKGYGIRISTPSFKANMARINSLKCRRFKIV